MHTSKSSLRSQLRAARISLYDAEREVCAVGLASAGVRWAADMAETLPGTFFAYLSTLYEPPTERLLVALLEAGHTVFVPVCEPNYQLSWTAWHPGIAMKRSTLAPVIEPVGPRYSFSTLEPVAGVFLPALAADLTGARLGQGGGYYDRFLAQLEQDSSSDSHAGDTPAAPTPTAAVVNDEEVLDPDIIPQDSLDRPVDWIITPSGVRKCDMRKFFDTSKTLY
ncbi:5-formyltetrahydrofolate cyclo-ligase [Arthrobacter cryoconiti]|uniref:5-formyltetrahydrofolate cyclo-ligase n=1 Tax=Arthrobacter cryoconiti TaxID=748907 RepID=A0ABV8R0W1_9MICC|nr:5-formyltetrahydrofolate cyclo-ligase [Arthrobacter cryoconiti]MCC9069300.1 5-formyltetrahydrofolate cyclo-ligase [Arthrobacter cryoconiti]